MTGLVEHNSDRQPPARHRDFVFDLRPIASALRNAVCNRLASLDTEVEIREQLRNDRVAALSLSAGGPLAITVHDPRFYRIIAMHGALGAADAYRRGFWTCNDLTSLFRLFTRRIGSVSRLERSLAWAASIPAYAAHLMRRNGTLDARKNIEAHYNLGNEFFSLFLDPTLTYSSGIFETGLESMQDASIAKLDRICAKLQLEPGMEILEIGTGWGSFAIHAARKYGCRVTTVTLSSQQLEEAQKRIASAGLNDRVSAQLRDYREVKGQFDRIASIEMIEAIGHHRLPEFFHTCASLLKNDGYMAIQAITMPDQGFEDYLRRTDVIREYIFPGSCCPSRQAILNAATSASDLRLVHLEEIGRHYALTLAKWRGAFLSNLQPARKLGYSDEFLRLWHFYLCYCEAGFAENHVGDVQLVFSKPGHVHRDPAPLPAIQCPKVREQ